MYRVLSFQIPFIVLNIEANKDKNILIIKINFQQSEWLSLYSANRL